MNLLLNLIPVLFVISFLIAIIFVMNKLFRNKVLNQTQKIFWTLIILSIPILGSISFLYIYKNEK